MLLFLRNDLPVLCTTYDCDHSDCLWLSPRLEAKKSHRYTNSCLPAF